MDFTEGQAKIATDQKEQSPDKKTNVMQKAVSKVGTALKL